MPASARTSPHPVSLGPEVLFLGGALGLATAGVTDGEAAAGFLTNATGALGITAAGHIHHRHRRNRHGRWALPARGLFSSFWITKGGGFCEGNNRSFRQLDILPRVNRIRHRNIVSRSHLAVVEPITERNRIESITPLDPVIRTRSLCDPVLDQGPA